MRLIQSLRIPFYEPLPILLGKTSPKLLEAFRHIFDIPSRLSIECQFGRSRTLRSQNHPPNHVALRWRQTPGYFFRPRQGLDFLHASSMPSFQLNARIGLFPDPLAKVTNSIPFIGPFVDQASLHCFLKGPLHLY